MSSILSSKWVAWEHRAKASEDVSWTDQFLRVCEFDTVENFWVYATHYPPPSTLFRGSSPGKPPPKILRRGRESRVLGIMLLKNSVPPETRAKDSMGERLTGGRLIGDVSTSFDGLKNKSDRLWETLCLIAIGSILPDDLVNGVWICNRTKWEDVSIKLRLEIWLSPRGVEESDSVLKILAEHLPTIDFSKR